MENKILIPEELEGQLDEWYKSSLERKAQWDEWYKSFHGTISLEYVDLKVTIYSNYDHNQYEEWWDEKEEKIDWEYEADFDSVIEELDFLLEEKIPDPDERDVYMLNHLEDLLEEYDTQLCEIFRDRAEEDAQENYIPD